MLNYKKIKNKISQYFISKPKNTKVNKKFVQGTPITVLDVKTNKSFEFLSINEASRYFYTYPKTI
jgi:hypothetical protein